MKLKYNITFESDTHPPETVEGWMEASGIRPLVGRALQHAIKVKPTTRYWSSLVIVLDKGVDGKYITDVSKLEGQSENG